MVTSSIRNISESRSKLDHRCCKQKQKNQPIRMLILRPSDCLRLWKNLVFIESWATDNVSICILLAIPYVVSLKAGYRWSTAAHETSHPRLLTLRAGARVWVFALRHFYQKNKLNLLKPLDSIGLIFTGSYRFVSLNTTPTSTSSKVEINF